MQNKRKRQSSKNKKIRIIGAIVCIIVLVSFIAGIIMGAIGGYKLDIKLMRTGIRMSIISRIFMRILHILYFRTNEKFRKMLYGK